MRRSSIRSIGRYDSQPSELAEVDAHCHKISRTSRGQDCDKENIYTLHVIRRVV